jgi:hypothetical protein
MFRLAKQIFLLYPICLSRFSVSSFLRFLQDNFHSFSRLSPLTLLSKFHIDVYPDPAFHFDAYPDSTFHCSDPNRLFLFDADPDLSFLCGSGSSSKSCESAHWPTDLHGSILSLHHGFRVRLHGSTVSLYSSSINLRGSDADPPRVDVDPDPALHLNADPDPAFLNFFADSEPAFHSNVRIRIHLLLFTQCADPDPAFYFYSDSDPGFHSNVRIRIQLFYFYAD